MKWKLTGQFLFAVLMIVAIVVVVNVIILFTLLYQNASEQGGDANDRIALNLADEMTLVDGDVQLSENGRQQLDKIGAWLQFLNEDGDVVSAIRTTDDVKTKYTPYDLIHDYKYYDETRTTIYVSRFENYSYVMGIPNSTESRLVTMINEDNLVTYIFKAIAIIAVVDLIIAAIIGLIFGSVITRPVRYLIERIQQLTNDGTKLKRPSYLGIYKPVYNNLETVNEQLLSNEQERQKLEKMRTEWVTNVSHDLKTPLATIQGYAEFLQDDTLSTEERQQYAGIIEKRSIYIKELLDDLSLTMRLRNNESVLQTAPVTMASFVREVVIDVLNDADFEGRIIEFDSTMLDDENFLIDQRLMKRAILNFIHNAFIHNGEETELQVRLSEHSLTIADNGKGISADDLAQVFERYYRGSNTENIRGTGLGMAIARDIIEAHGFTVEIQSEVGEGTTVIIQFQ